MHTIQSQQQTPGAGATTAGVKGAKPGAPQKQLADGKQGSSAMNQIIQHQGSLAGGAAGGGASAGQLPQNAQLTGKKGYSRNP